MRVGTIYALEEQLCFLSFFDDSSTLWPEKDIKTFQR